MKTEKNPVEYMFYVAENISNAVIIPKRCALDREDVYQEVCLRFIESGYDKILPYTAYQWVLADSIQRWITSKGCEIAHGLLGDIFEYNTEIYDGRHTTHETVCNDIIEILETLSDKQCKVICYRFGLGKDKAHTLREISDIMGYKSVERSRQIEARALHKIRRSYRAKLIKDAFDICYAIYDY